MSERKLGSVTYREVGQDYFDKRGCGDMRASGRSGRSASGP